SPQGIYEVTQAAGDLYRAVQIDQSKYRDHPDNWDPPVVAAADQPAPAAPVGVTADTGETIDIMVAYTATARQAAGSTAAMATTIQTALNESNTAYANSGVTPRLRLVHSVEVAYTESGNISADLNRLTSTNDGVMDEVHTLRNTYGADMVGLIVENCGGYCGVANTIGATASSAFQVTARNCATGYYSFGHEFGHLQSARHDTYVDSSTTPYAYGHGYVNTSTDSTKRWRTIMAYNNGCSDLGYNCTRINYWSNPTNTYLTQPMGVVGTAENYKVLNNTAYTVANFRAEVTNPTFAVSVSPTSGSVTVGASTSTTVSTSALSGTPPTLSLSATGLPTGVTASFSPTSVTAGSGSTLTLSAASGTAAGSYTVTVNATSGGTTVSTSYALTVVVPNSFNDSFTSTVGNWSAVTGTWALNGSGQYQSSGVTNAWSSVANSAQFGDGTYQVTMTRSGGTAGMGTGIIVRANTSSRTTNGTWTPSYSFQYTNNRTYSVWKVDSSGTSTALKSWTSSRAIVKGGANTLKVVASGSSLQFSINGTVVWTGTDSLLSVGQVGVGFVRDGTSSTLRIDAASSTPA
ncbi:MAG: M12 family metallo-peptidase, partial [Actinomycetota bacterium]